MWRSVATLEEVVDHDIEFFKVVVAVTPPGAILPVGSSNGVNWDRAPSPRGAACAPAYLKKL